MTNNEPLVTRKGLVKHINEATGVPLTKSSFDKLAMLGQTPKPDAYYGKVELYKPSRGEAWARERLCSRVPVNLGVNKSEMKNAAQ